MAYVKDIISEWMLKIGVKVMFGIPGSYVLPLIDSASRKSIPFILSQHEYGAALMADGFAKANGGIPCVVTTTGIAATNALSGIYNSYSDGQPVLFITGQVPTTLFGKGALQESIGVGRTIHLERIFEGVTKYSKMIINTEMVNSILSEAEYALLEGRKGPVHLCIPIDILQSEISESEVIRKNIYQKPFISGDVFLQLKSLLEKSKKPLLLVGAGCRSEFAEKQIRTIADNGIPVATTLRGKGVMDENHQLALGCIGMYGESKANYYMDQFADLVIAVGVSMSEFTTQCWNPVFERVKLVHVDVDPSQIGKNFSVTLGIHGEADDFLNGLVSVVNGVKDNWDEAKDTIIIAKSKFQKNEDVVIPRSTEQKKLHPLQVVHSLWRKMPADKTVWVTDAVVWTENMLRISGAYRHIEAVNQASIGYAPAAAVGVKTATPSQYVVSIFGDGGFRQTAMELATAVSYNKAVLWVIFNNEKYGSIYAAQKGYYGGNIVGTTYAPIDFVEFGRSLGVESALIQDEETLCKAIESFIQEERPMLLDVRIDDSLPETKARQLIRYQHWKLKKPDNIATTKDDLKTLSQLLQNRY